MAQDDDDEGRDQDTATLPAGGGGAGPDDPGPDQSTLDDLGARIDTARTKLAEQLEGTDLEGTEGEHEPAAREDEPVFIQEGDASEDQPVDDTIAPPG